MSDRAVRPSLFDAPNGPGRRTGFGFRIPVLPEPPRFSDELSALLGLPTAPRLPGAGGPSARAAMQSPPPTFRPDRIQLAESPVSESPPGVDPDLRRRVPPTDAVPGSDGPRLDAVKRIGEAATKAVGRIFEEPLGASRESLGPLVAQSPVERRGVAGLFRAFNEVFVGGGSVAVDGAFRTMVAPVVGGIAATVQALQELGMSRTDARRLERDLYAGVTVLGLKSGPALGLQPRLPGPKRVLADANRQGVFEKALAKLPPDQMEAAKAQLESAFRKGHELGVKARSVTAQDISRRVGLDRLSREGRQLFDRVARKLGKRPTSSVFEKLAKEGIPTSQNIAEGKTAIETALSKRTSVPAAMYRRDVGEITIDYGKPGDPSRNFAEGFGLSHIVARRNAQGQNGEEFVREILPEVLAKGRLSALRTSKIGDRRAQVVYRGNVAILSLFRDQRRETWVLTGFRDRKFRNPRSKTRIGPSRRNPK